MKTKRIINISVAALLVIALLWTLCWFYVRGATLRVLKAIPSDCKITVAAGFTPAAIFYSFASFVRESAHEPFKILTFLLTNRKMYTKLMISNTT